MLIRLQLSSRRSAGKSGYITHGKKMMGETNIVNAMNGLLVLI